MFTYMIINSKYIGRKLTNELQRCMYTAMTIQLRYKSSDI